MTPELHQRIVHLMNEHRIMTVATSRPDGWPQATIVGYVNDEMVLYSFITRMGQKYANIARDPRVSVAIARNFSDPLDIKGLSLAGIGAFVENKHEFERAVALFMARHPEYASWPRPAPALAPMLRITPTVISVIDYSKGFGHSDLVNVSGPDLATADHNWLADC